MNKFGYKGKLIPAVLFLVLSVLILSAGEVIKIGSTAPERSPWSDALRRVSREWEKITGGRVSLKIYSGGITGNEEDTIRKVRFGMLGGAALTNMGMVKIHPEVYVLNTPFLFKSDDELKYVLDKMKPYFEQKFEEKGFKVIVWTLAGWVHFFTKEPALTPDDMKQFKIGFSTGEPEMEQAWKRMGYHVVPTHLKDLLMALQSGMVDACYLPPLFAGLGQYFPLVPHLNELRVAPLLGSIVIAEKIWKRIPSEFHQPMMDYCDSLTDELYQTILDLEREAIDSMKKHGLIVNAPAAATLPDWAEQARLGVEGMIGKTFSQETYDQVLEHLNEYRKTNDPRQY
jgi:TRAP-type C4-dicarboxylate transport system substrate-binding protein